MICIERNPSPSTLNSIAISSDAAFDRRLSEIGHEIAKRDETNLITLCGPSCAGKTTCSRKLKKALADEGKRLHIVSIDDFYLDRDLLIERSGTDKIDFESAETLDLDFLKLTFERIADRNATEVELPHFDFKSGKRTAVNVIQKSFGDVFLFEGIQTLYPEIKPFYREFATSSIYIAPMRSISIEGKVFEPNGIRFLRRMVRDFARRNATPALTFKLWDGVRENEEKNIFPYIKDNEFIIDSTMPYELYILKPYVEALLAGIAPEYRDRAISILSKLEGLSVLSANVLSPDSLYREFV